ncbi:MAG TPA: hypothetical protein VG897_05530 [Terriglobales bacterium]|nr:hypothetical protein [Terriglobales bacterium]
MPWSIFKAVKGSLDELDIEGLLSLGCPGDEYDGEASLIEGQVARLSNYGKREVSISDMETIITEVWNAQFGPMSEEELKRRQSAFKSLAERICNQVNHA